MAFELDKALLTDEAIDRSRQRVGIPQPRHNPPHNFEVTRDAIRHFAYGYGDDNSLYCDPAYAAGTRWGDVIAPPAFVYTMGERCGPPLTPEQKLTMTGDPFAGLGSYQAVMEFEWWRPLRIGDRLLEYRTQVGVIPKRSEFSGKTAHVTIDFVYKNQNEELIALQRGTWINAERHASRDRKKEEELPQVYTSEALAQVDADYDSEVRRGSQRRYWEDVTIGEELPLKVKGPLVISDIIRWHMGVGMGITPPGSFQLTYQTRKKVPGLFPPNWLNVPDTVQRVHWERERAQQLGLPDCYDYGAMRETWLCHLVTDWMGDDGWLWKLSCQHRRFNFQGDTVRVKGRVVDKKQSEGRNEVYLDIWCENQRGAVNTPGNAVVLLPTRANPVIDLPPPPAASMEDLIDLEIGRIAATTNSQAGQESEGKHV